MTWSGFLSASSRRAVIGFGLAAVLGVATVAAAQTTPPPTTPPPAQQPAAPAPAQADAFKFSSDGAAILWFIKPEKVADFESVMGMLKAKMLAAPAEKADWKTAGESMKLFKLNGEPGPDGIGYITTINPASKTTSYSPTEVLFNSGLFDRAEADQVYKRLQEALNKVIAWPLTKIGG